MLQKKAKEKNLEPRLKKFVEALGGIAFKFLPFAFTGLPDRIVLMPGGRIWFVELKSEGMTPKPRQKFVHRQLRRLGFSVWTIGTEETLLKFFNEVQPA